MRYYSTYPSGLAPVVEKCLIEDFSSVEIINNMDGLIEYQLSDPVKKILSLPYLNNTFLIIHKLRTGSFAIKKMVSKILSLKNLDSANRLIDRAKGKSFRVIISNENKLSSIDPRTLSSLERKIASNTGLVSNRSRPDIEFWIIYRTEGYFFFSMRLSVIKKHDKFRKKGELRPQIAHLLCRISNPQEKELFLDPFCGSGTIPLSRVRLSKTGLIFASDNNAELIESLKAKVKKLKLKKRLMVQVADGLQLRFEDASIHKIVTDPPWGAFEFIKNPEAFYKKILGEFDRILKPDGILVLLTSQEIRLSFLIKNNFDTLKITASYSILVSGKKAMIYKIIKQQPHSS